MIYQVLVFFLIGFTDFSHQSIEAEEKVFDIKKMSVVSESTNFTLE